MTDEKRIDERVEALNDEELEGASGGKRIEVVNDVSKQVEALSDDELEGASGGKRIEVVDAGFGNVNPKGVWAESAAPMSDSEGPTTILI